MLKCSGMPYHIAIELVNMRDHNAAKNILSKGMAMLAAGEFEY